MPWARTARHLEAPIASQAPITAIIGHTHTMCRITDFTGRGVGPTSAVLGGGDRGMFRSSCECCRFAAFRERERALQVSSAFNTTTQSHKTSAPSYPQG